MQFLGNTLHTLEEEEACPNKQRRLLPPPAGRGAALHAACACVSAAVVGRSARSRQTPFINLRVLELIYYSAVQHSCSTELLMNKYCKLVIGCMFFCGVAGGNVLHTTFLCHQLYIFNI